MILDELSYGQEVIVRISAWCPVGHFRISLRVTKSYGSATEYISWTARLVPAWCAANYIGIDPSFTYTAANDAEMADVGLKAWVLGELGLEAYAPASPH